MFAPLPYLIPSSHCDAVSAEELSQVDSSSPIPAQSIVEPPENIHATSIHSNSANCAAVAAVVGRVRRRSEFTSSEQEIIRPPFLSFLGSQRFGRVLIASDFQKH